MMNRNSFLKATLCSLAALASFGQTVDHANNIGIIRAFAMNSSGLAEIVPDADIEENLEGLRGCLDNAGDACPDGRRITSLLRQAPGRVPVLIRVEGDAPAEELTVVVNGEEVYRGSDVSLPAEVPVTNTEDDGIIHVTARVGGADEHRQYQIGAGREADSTAFKMLASTRPTASIFRFFANVPEEGVWEVIPGSNTGGRLIPTATRCILALPVSSCPLQWRVFGYTDRASRGDQVMTHVNYQGAAQRLGVIINGRVRGQWFNVPIPIIVPQNVSLNPADDNIFAFAQINGVYVERRLPVGRR